jgi:O-antigen/teichoic acid export membrane protein
MMSGVIGLILARLVSPAISFFLVVLIARILGQTLLGQYVTIWVWFTLFLYCSLFGLGEYISKEVGAKSSHAPQYLAHGLLIVLATSSICAVAMAAGAVLFRYPDAVRHGIMIASLALPFAACIVVSQAVFIAFQKVKYIVLASFTENIIFLVSGIVIIVNHYKITTLIWCLLSVKIIALALNLFICHKHITPLKFNIKMGFLKKLLAPVAAFGITGIAGQVFMRIDLIMLSKMTDMVSVSLYSSASKLMEVSCMLPLSFYLMNLPVTASGYKKYGKLVHREIETGVKQLFMFAALQFGLVFLFAKPILVLTYGESFAGADWMLKILMVAFFVTNAEIVLAMSCQAAGYHKTAMHISVGRAIINIALNFILIPLYGGIGAALATLFAIIFSFILYQYFLKQSIGSIHWLRIIPKPFLVCLAVMISLYPLVGKLSVFLLGFIFFIVYGLIFLALNGFSIGRVFRLNS